MIDTTSREFFEEKYRKQPDPWSFASSAYEQSRYDAILKALGDRRFRCCLEPGCSIGVLTERLASLADSVEASDISPRAVQRARDRCKHLGNVTISIQQLSTRQSYGSFDLLILSEIGYYFSDTSLTRVAETLIDHLEKGGVFLAAHWLGKSRDHLLTGDRVHEILHQLGGLIHQVGQRHTAFRPDAFCPDGFRLDTWLKQ